MSTEKDFVNRKIPDLIITDNTEFLLNEINRFKFNIIEQNSTTELKTELVKKLEEMEQIVNVHKTKENENISISVTND